MIKLFCVIAIFASHSIAFDIRGALCKTWCLARCESMGNVTEINCEAGCRKYESSDLCPKTDNICRSQCVDLGNVTANGSIVELPVNISALYVGEFTDELPDPYEVRIKWSPVEEARYYFLEWKSGVLDSFKTLNGSVTTAKIRKSHLCAPVAYRLRAVSEDGISDPSQWRPLAASNVEYGSQCCPRLKVVNYTWLSNEDAKVNISYTLPSGWDPDDITAVDIQSPTHPKTPIDVDTNSSTFTITIRKDLLYADAQMVFLIYSMSTRCGGEKTYFDLRDETSITLFLDCSSMKEMFPDHPATIERCSTCPRNFTCGIMSTQPDYVYNCSRDKTPRIQIGVSWNLTWVPPLCPDGPLFWITRWTISEEAKNGDGTAERVTKSTNEISRSFGTSLTQYKMLPMGHIYHFEACAIYNNFTAKDDFVFDSRNPVIKFDLTGDNCFTSVDDKHDSNSVIIGVCLGVIGGIMVAAIACSCWWRHRRKSTIGLSLGTMPRRQGNAYHPFELRPQVADHFEIDLRKVLIFENEVLGKGAFGKVYKGQLTTRCPTFPSNRPGLAPTEEAESPIVAVKQCYATADETTKQDFKQEISLMKKLYYYPRIVNILQCVSKTEPLSLIVEYCAGGDLLHFLRVRRDYMTRLESLSVDYANPHPGEDFDRDMVIDYRDVVRMQYEVADGMEYISEKGFIHRDLAARNILVDANRHVKIGDFGLCRFVYTDATYTSRGGKLPIKWMALEAIESYEFTTKSDVWSFAVLAFEIITVGGVPYADVNPDDGDIRKAMLEYLRSGARIEQPDNCALDLYELMCNCWKADPKLRPGFKEVKEFFRRMYESVASNDSPYYGFYIDPGRSYYNIDDPNDGLITQDSGGSGSSNHRVANGDVTNRSRNAHEGPAVGLITPHTARHPTRTKAPVFTDVAYANLGFLNSEQDDSGYDGAETGDIAQQSSRELGSLDSASPHSSSPSVTDEVPSTSAPSYQNLPREAVPQIRPGVHKSAYDNPLYADSQQHGFGPRRPPHPLPRPLLGTSDSIPLETLASPEDLSVGAQRREHPVDSSGSSISPGATRTSRSPRQSILNSPLPLVGTSSAITHSSSHTYANLDRK